jgi:hypothetical protein
LGLEAEDPAERFRQLLYQRHLLPYHPPRARR